MHPVVQIDGRKIFHLRKSNLKSLFGRFESRDLGFDFYLELLENFLVIERPRFFESGPVENAEIVGFS